jgi:hypothetical protein
VAEAVLTPIAVALASVSVCDTQSDRKASLRTLLHSLADTDSFLESVLAALPPDLQLS